jgi:CRP/FNR family transcriptional regulator, cyclic AMP receptor protein
MDIKQRSESLSKVSLFAGLDERHLKALAAACAERSFKKDEYLMRQGENGVGLFVIVGGSVRVVKSDSALSSVTVGTNKAGDVMGEMAVLDGARRTADVIAEEATECLVLPSWDFNSIMKSHPEMALAILPVVVARFRETNAALTGLKGKK